MVRHCWPSITSTQPMASLLAIYLRPAARLPVRAVQSVHAIANVGLDGDHAVSGRRQVTLLARESWQDACRELGQDVDPSVRRANLLVAGINLADCLGKTLRVGPVTIDVLGETRPCELLDDHGRIGLYAALRRERRGGVFGTVRIGGLLTRGDAVVADA